MAQLVTLSAVRAASRRIKAPPDPSRIRLRRPFGHDVKSPIEEEGRAKGDADDEQSREERTPWPFPP